MTDTVVKKRGTYAPARRRRSEVVQAALDLVDELGHEFVTTALVSQRSGVIEATILYHFPTKDHLFVGVLERVDEVSERVNLPDSRVPFDPEFLRNSGENDNRARLLIAMRGQVTVAEHPARDYFKHRVDRAVELFAQVIEDRKVAGTAHPNIDSQQAARQFYSLWEGLLVMRETDNSFDAGAAAVDGFRRLTGANVMEIAHAMSSGELGA